MSTNPYGEPANPIYSNNPGGAYPPSNSAGSPVLAIVSLVCGILGLFPGCCCLFIGVPFQLAALVTGGIALTKPAAPGRGMAIAGVALGALGIVWIVFSLILAVLNPDFAKQMQQMQQQMQQMQPNQNP